MGFPANNRAFCTSTVETWQRVDSQLSQLRPHDLFNGCIDNARASFSTGSVERITDIVRTR